MTKKQSIKDWGDKIIKITPDLLEQYRPVPNTGGGYLVDRCGNVIQVDRAGIPDGYAARCCINQSRVEKPYSRVYMRYPDNKIHAVTLGRVVLMAWVGMPPTKHHQACHLNGITTDDRLENLEWKMPVGVKKKSIERDSWAHGTKVHTQRLSEDRVKAIRRILREFAVPSTLMARALGMNQARLKEIKSRISWATKAEVLARSGKYSKLPTYPPDVAISKDKEETQ